MRYLSVFLVPLVPLIGFFACEPSAFAGVMVVGLTIVVAMVVGSIVSAPPPRPVLPTVIPPELPVPKTAPPRDRDDFYAAHTNAQLDAAIDAGGGVDARRIFRQRLDTMVAFPSELEIARARVRWLSAMQALRSGDPTWALATLDTLHLPRDLQPNPHVVAASPAHAGFMRTLFALGVVRVVLDGELASVVTNQQAWRVVEGTLRYAEMLAELQRRPHDKIDSSSIAAYYASIASAMTGALARREAFLAAHQRIMEGAFVHVSHFGDENPPMPHVPNGVDSLMTLERYGGRVGVDCEGLGAARLLTLPPGFSPIAVVVSFNDVDSHLLVVFRDSDGHRWVASNTSEPKRVPKQTGDALSACVREISAEHHQADDGALRFHIYPAVGDDVIGLIAAYRANASQVESREVWAQLAVDPKV